MPSLGQWTTSGSNIYYTGGSVGIGTSVPSEKLTIAGGNILVPDGDDILPNGAAKLSQNGLFIVHDWATLNTIPTGLGIAVSRVAPAITVRNNGIGAALLVEDGNVGIGTATPDYELDVNGTARAKEVIVESGWADFVFEDGYDLPTLAEVERHIEAHGHLPEVPSAAAVQANGVKLGESQALLLQKIEELTLYLIDMKYGMDELRHENAKLTAEIAVLRQAIK